ncbi:MAG: hypothetical protein WC557_07240 [Ignavibacteriaceae bacterium]
MKKFTLLVSTFGILLSVGSFAQEKNLREKLNKIDGNVESIVIKTDKGTVTFSGEEAKSLMKRMQSKTSAKKIIILDNDDENSLFEEESDIKVDRLRLPMKKIKVFRNGAPDGEIEINISDILDSPASNNVEKKVVVQNKDGNKIVTVTTKENGSEKIEMFEGADAENYLKEHKIEKGKDAPSSKELKKKVKKIVIEDENEK